MAGDSIDVMKIVEIAEEAGRRILEIYGLEDFQVETKDDDSPLTAADRESNAIITTLLRELPTDIPILSEEDTEKPFSERRGWKSFWLVDPVRGSALHPHRPSVHSLGVDPVLGDPVGRH